MNRPVTLSVLMAGGALLAVVGIGAGENLVSHHGLMVAVDAAAGSCLACHDGRLARGRNVCLEKCSFSTAHSILKRYPPPGKERYYAPLESLASRGIQLEDGKVSCISCHDLSNPGKDHLVMENRQSRLCLSCHLW